MQNAIDSNRRLSLLELAELPEGCKGTAADTLSEDSCDVKCFKCSGSLFLGGLLLQPSIVATMIAMSVTDMFSLSYNFAFTEDYWLIS
jgi:hypothetical protein